jgi:nanoRNase/pAp phosphatase (c-di-AMP/oligoRNAs hydrolase)
MSEHALPLPPGGPKDPGPRPGQAPVDRLRAVLERASAAAPEAARGRFLVLTHRGPDPDALGACEGLRRLIEVRFGFEATVATLGRIHRAENMALVRALGLALVDYDEIDVTGYAGVTLVDTQPEFGHTVLPAAPPLVAVFDHHVPPESQTQRPEALHRDVRLGLGATCSMIYEYLRDAQVELDERTASALFCGVRYDTMDLSRNVSPLDEEAYFETFRRGDRAKIADIDRPPLPRSYYRAIASAMAAARQHGPLVLALLGKIENPETVAEMADFFLRMKGVSWVVVGGAFEGEYVLSLRTDKAFGNAYPLMERVLGGEGSFGGHGHIAGGRLRLEDDGESTVKSIERRLRANALKVIAPSGDDEESIPPEGRGIGE